MKNSFPYPGLVLGGMMNRLLAWREVVDKVVKTSFQTLFYMFFQDSYGCFIEN